MRTLALLAEFSSIAATARFLGISAAAVSKQLTRLEEELGLQLLLRSTRHVEFTEIGKSYCEQCQRVLEEVEAANALISQMKARPKGNLKVMSGRHFATSYIIPYLAEFLTRYPEITLSLEIAERMPDLNVEMIDVLIGMSLSATGDVIQKRIGTTHYTFCASPVYLEKFGIPEKPFDLHQHRYITHSMRQPDDILVFKNKETIQLTPYIKINDTEMMLKVAQQGLGIVKLHHYVVKDLVNKGVLVELLKPYEGTEIPLNVAFPKRRFISAKVRAFIDFTIELMASTG